MVAFGTILARYTGALILATITQTAQMPGLTMAGNISAQAGELIATDGQIYDHFGVSMAIAEDGRTLLIGAAYRNSRIGAAYVFSRVGGVWRQQAELTASDGKVDDQFGYAVALSQDGNTALIGGAMQRNGSTGEVYVFSRRGSTWQRQALLRAPDGVGNDEFGHSVALSQDGRTALIGAVGRHTFTGAAYLFARSGANWNMQKEFTAPGGKESDTFGSAVALAQDGSNAIVSAPGRNYETGAVYIYARRGEIWSGPSVLKAADGLVGDTFGNVVALSLDGGTLMVGAPDRNTGMGAVYVFSRQGTRWVRTAELTSAHGKRNELFGDSLALSQDGTTALVGARSYQPSGAAYVYGRHGTNWVLEAALVTPGQLTGANFGASAVLSQDGSVALVGADGPFTAGIVYLFARRGTAWK